MSRLDRLLELTRINTKASAQMPSDIPEKIAIALIKAEEKKAKYGVIVGLICIILGFILSIIGVAGIINWNFKVGNYVNNSLMNASPGVVLIFIGFFIIWVTTLKITIENNK